MKKRSKIKARIKGILILIIILAALGASFYFGYYQFQLPVDTYGVIFTKWFGGGWDQEVVSPGTNRIEWKGLLPTNLRIEKFEILPRTVELSVSGELPSADSYSSLLEGNPDFSYDYRFSVSYIIDPDHLPSLVSDSFLRSDNTSSWYEDLEKSLVVDGITFLNKKSADDDYMARISYNFRLIEEDLISELSAQYDYLTFVKFVPLAVHFPDMDLYREGKRLYFSMSSFNEKVNKRALELASKRLVEESAKLDLLRRYGAVFSEYPELIEYYTIHSNDGKDLIPTIELPDITD